MVAKIMDGKAIAQEIQAELAASVAELTATTGITPCLAAVLVGVDPASEVYVRNKQRVCERIGLTSELHKLPADTSQSQLLELIQRLN